jgi:general secretion pathway protein A
VYNSFFGLQKNPFTINPDPTYLCLTPQLEATLADLQDGLLRRRGLMVLTGEAGTGKTTLVNHLLQWLDHQRARTAFIFNSHVDSAQLFDFILADFEVPITPQMNANPLLAFNEWLLGRYRAGELVVLIVDEAQGLPRQVLEEIRLLSNMETPGEKLLQILLVGQPELETKLKRPDLRQLQQRIELRCKTAPLTLKETRSYIESRLHTAGTRNPGEIFSADAIETVHNYSRGIPRVVNLLCENALIDAFAERQRKVVAANIFEGARELQFDDYKPLAPRGVTVFPQPAEPIDLRMILGKYADEAREAAEDDRRRAEAALSVLPGLDGGPARQGRGPRVTPAAKSSGAAAAAAPARVTAERIEGLVASSSGELNGGAMAENFAPKKPAPPIPVERPRERGWKRDLSGNLLLSMIADVRYAGRTTARFVRDLRMPERTTHAVRGAARRVQSARWGKYRAMASAHASKAWSTLSAETRAGVAGVRRYAAKQTVRMQKRWWWRQNSLEELYWESFAATAIVSALMFFVARRVYPAQSWAHPALVVLAFGLFLLSALAAAIAVRVLVGAREELREDALSIFHAARRWLRAPLETVQVGTVNEKMPPRGVAERN